MGAGDFFYSPGGSSVPNPLNITPGTTPATPTTGINFASMLFANKALPVWKDQAGQLWNFQDALWNNAAVILSPRDGTSTLGCIGGTSIITADTSVVSTSTPANTSRYTRATKTIHTSVAAINRGAGFAWNSTNPARMWLRGSAAGQGGFFAFFRFGLETYAAGNRMFVGMNAATETAFYTADPSANTGNYIGLAMDAADTTVKLISRNNATTTPTAIAGAPAAAGSGAFFVDFYLYCQPNDTTVYYRLDDLVAGTTIVDTSTTTTLPVNTTLMNPVILTGTGTSAAACAVAIAKVYTIGQQN